MKLFTYFRSSAAFRVRIALLLKNVEHEAVYVHLRRDEQKAPSYAALNPQKFVPSLIDGPDVLNQSMAIIEYLEEKYPDPPLLPRDTLARARIRSIAGMIACDIHPLNNLRVLDYLKTEAGLPQEKIDEWYGHWIDEGFSALEAILAKSEETGTFCHGGHPTVADICLVPQVYNARRMKIDLTPYPTIMAINDACMGLPAFASAAPDVQPDADS